MSENTNYHRIVYYIAIVALFIFFIVILNSLPFPEHYNFWRYLGVGAATCVAGLIAYALMLAFVEKVMKILVELAGAILLFINAVFGAVCWAFFENVKLIALDWFPTMSDNLTTVTIISMVVILLIFNLLAMLILYPLSNITGANIAPLEEILE